MHPELKKVNTLIWKLSEVGRKMCVTEDRNRKLYGSCDGPGTGALLRSWMSVVAKLNDAVNEIVDKFS
jgi:hypothetical protein